MLNRHLLSAALAATGLAAGALPAFAGTYDVTYAQDVKPILDNNCVECHQPGGRDPDLSQFPFQSTRLNGQAAIVAKIVEYTGSATPKMPPGQRTKLTSDQVNLITEWQNEGLKP